MNSKIDILSLKKREPKIAKIISTINFIAIIINNSLIEYENINMNIKILDKDVDSIIK